MSNKYEYMNNPALWCSDIADAIREKTGETGLIDAVDYPEKIQEISDTIDYVNEDIRSVGSYAYYYMKNLKSVDMPNVTDIGYDAFSGCDQLISISIPNVESIGSHAFSTCVKLTNLPLTDKISKIEDYTFWECHNLTNADIPNSVTSIGYDAFYGCSNIKTIILPENLVSIDNSAFGQCRKVNKIYWNAINLGNSFGSDNYVFDQCGIEGDGIEVVFGENVEVIPQSAFNPYSPSGGSNRPKIKNVVFNNKIYLIGNSAFSNCWELESIEIPDSVTDLQTGAFRGCESLSYVKLPLNITALNSHMFQYCKNLNNIELPNKITEIYGQAFQDCANLTNIVLPNSLTSIREEAFLNCNNLTNVFYYGTEEDWNSISIGDNNECLTNATIHYIDDPSKQVCNIRYNTNGGNGVFSDKMVIEGETIVLSTDIPTKFLCGFLGWADNPDATEVQHQPGDSYIVTEDVTLYAVWEQTAQIKTLTYQAPETVDSAIISTGGEHYYFKFTPTESGYYTFSSTIPDGDGDGYCYLYDEQGFQLASDDDGAGNLNFNLDCYMEANTTYYYGVKYWDSEATGTIPVRLIFEDN